MSQAIVSFVLALLFGAGLAVGGMTQPEKIVGFLDVFGDWDPSLMLVMAGALAVYMPVYQLIIRKRPSPLLGEQFRLATRQHIDRRLIIGALLFGIGWGMGGFCPGPAISAVGAFIPSAVLFTVAMFFGFGLGELIETRS